MTSLAARVERVERFVRAAQKLVDPEHQLGREAQQELPRTTGLSAAGVRYALDHCFERCPSTAVLRSICRARPEAPAVHVLLSANVFVAPLRAIGLALASSERVYVRPSRREPLMTDLLARAAPGTFVVVGELEPRVGEHVWAYGTDATLASVTAQLPSGTVCHAYGSGFGAALLDARGCRDAETASRLVQDIIAFDQRGCLSPRFAVVAGPPELAHQLVDDLGRQLSVWQQRVPRGRLSDDERADLTRFTRTMIYASDGFVTSDAGTVVLVSDAERWLLPPVGRALVVVSTDEPLELLATQAPQLTQVGVACSPALTRALTARLPRVRVTPLGRMQRPAFDGPVDRRDLGAVLGRS